MSSILKDIKNLFVGLVTTAKHLPRKEVTIQYPDEKWPMPERSRGIVVLLSDKETGELNCTTCLLCERACPSAAIKIDYEKVEKKRKLKEFTVDNSLCCFCGLCEEACNFAAIKMAGKYEFATWDKTDLIWNTAKLQEMGRDVPYEPKKKRKPKPKPAAKPAPPVDETKTEKPAEPKAEVIEEKPAEQAPPADPKPNADIKPDDVETKNDESKDEQGDK